MVWTIRKILLLIVFIFTISIGGTLIWATSKYQQFASDAMSDSLAVITQDLVHQHIWRYHDAAIKPFVAGWSIVPTLANGITEKDTEKLVVTIDRMFSTPETKNRIIHLRNVVIYDSDMNILAVSTRGNGENLSEHPSSIDRLRSQPAGKKRRGFNVLWQTSNGRPVLSTIAPIGGFRLLGFIEFVTDPILALSDIADSAGGTFRLKDREGNILITSEPADDGTSTDRSETDSHPGSFETLSFALNGTEEKPWGYATLTLENHLIAKGAEAVNFQILVVDVAISIATFIVAWWILHLSVFRKIRRFVDVIESLADGNTDVKIPKTGSDEFAHLRKALESLQTAVKSRHELQKRTEAEITERQKIETRLRTTMRDLEQANNAKSEFLAHMSHELRTPLNAISGFSQMIADEIFGGVGHPKYKEYANDVNGASMHLLTLINDILDLAKIEAGQFSFNEECFKIGEAIHESATLLLRDAGESRRYILPAINPAVTLLADKRLFKQIVLNLLSNADKFTPENGTITITVDADQHSNLLLKMKDTGCGIAKENLQTVLEPFGQARTDSKVTHEGTGLGIPISQKFMELHGGALSIESEPDKGTTVTLMFPKERVTWGKD